MAAGSETASNFFFTAAFLTAMFWGATCLADAAFAAALCKRRRFLEAVMIRFMPAALIRLLGFEGSGTDGAFSLILAHRACCATAIRFRAAALNFLRLPLVASGATVGLTCAVAGAPTSRKAAV